MEEGLSCPFWIFILLRGCGGNNAIPECINLWLGKEYEERGIWGFYNWTTGMKETPDNQKERRDGEPQDGLVCRGREGNERYVLNNASTEQLHV